VFDNENCSGKLLGNANCHALLLDNENVVVHCWVMRIVLGIVSNHEQYNGKLLDDDITAVARRIMNTMKSRL
jgi:hypothetical protein